MEKLNLSDTELKKQQWKILFSSTGLCFLSGMFYMWSILSKSMVDDLGWTSSQASLPYTVYTLAFVVAMSIFGKIQDEKGPRLVVITGSILMGIGLTLSGIIITPFSMVVTSGIIAGLGIGMINSAVVAPALKWHPPTQNGLVTGIILGGTGFSAIFYSPLGTYLIGSIGIQKTFIAMGVISLVFSLILAKNVINPEVELFETAEDESEEKKRQFTWREMLKDADAYKLWLMFAFASTAGLMIISHASTIAFVQVGWRGGTFLVIILALFNTLGRIVGGIGSDRIGRINYLRIVLTIQFINMILFSFYSSIISVVLGSLAAGFCYGSNFSVFPASVADMYGKKHYGVNYGIVYTAWGVGGIIGPMVAANIFDKTGTYFTAYKVAAVLMGVGLIVSLTFGREKRNNKKMV